MKSRDWQRGANMMARNLWRDGKRGLAYQLLREVMKDSQTKEKQ